MALARAVLFPLVCCFCFASLLGHYSVASRAFRSAEEDGHLQGLLEGLADATRVADGTTAAEEMQSSKSGSRLDDRLGSGRFQWGYIFRFDDIRLQKFRMCPRVTIGRDLSIVVDIIIIDAQIEFINVENRAMLFHSGRLMMAVEQFETRFRLKYVIIAHSSIAFFSCTMVRAKFLCDGIIVADPPRHLPLSNAPPNA